jgi:iron complex transport system substrate-binding protein
VTLRQPARRIISLAPHITELLFAAGAGERVVGTTSYSEYPEGAKRIPRIGDSAQLDLERIVGLQPDLIVVWGRGSGQRQLDKLLQLGIPVFYNEPRRLLDIGRALEQFGKLAGTEAIALPAARAFAARVAELRGRYASRPPVRVFYQIWEEPLMTINGDQLISDVIRLCGGENVFADLKPLVPTLSTEAVITRDPEAILSSSDDNANSQSKLKSWEKWPQLKAVARDNLFVIHGDSISRSTPQVLLAAQEVCKALELARSRRPR